MEVSCWRSYADFAFLITADVISKQLCIHVIDQVACCLSCRRVLPLCLRAKAQQAYGCYWKGSCAPSTATGSPFAAKGSPNKAQASVWSAATCTDSDRYAHKQWDIFVQTRPACKASKGRKGV